jgi:hypothetical protein
MLSGKLSARLRANAGCIAPDGVDSAMGVSLDD